MGGVQVAPQPADERLAAERPAVFWGRGSVDRMISESATGRSRMSAPSSASGSGVVTGRHRCGDTCLMLSVVIQKVRVWL